MSDEEPIETKGKKKKSDFAEVEFGIGNIEFEAKGRSIVVERMFRMLLEKIEEGKLVAEFRLQDIDEEEEEEEEQDEEFAFEESEEELPPDTLGEVDDEPIPLGSGDTDSSLDPPPAWDSLETEEPEMSEAEKEEFDL